MTRNRSPPFSGYHFFLDLDSHFNCLLFLLSALLSLVSHNTTTPLLASLFVLLEIAILDGGDELGELIFVLGADFGECQHGSILRKFDCQFSSYIWQWK